jgi:TolB-like protein/Tfp pilus assembly protein PilF
VRDQIRDKLPYILEDRGEHEVKNIGRPVRVFAVLPPSSSRADRAAQASSAQPLALPDKPSIAVLPFTNMSGDAEQEYFADGIVDDITTALSRLRWLFVIARNSSFTYKGRAIDVKQVGRELGVRYVLEGSVRKSGDRVRITGQLIEAQTNAQLWAERYDGLLEDVFALQDRMTESIVGAIEPQLQTAEIERARRKPPGSMIAYDYYLRAQPHMHAQTRAGNDEALRLLREAVELEPGYPAACAAIAWCYEFRRSHSWSTSRKDDAVEGLRFARMAALSKDDPYAMAVAGACLVFFARERDRGMALVQQALALNPNMAFAWAINGWLHMYVGATENALAAFANALRLSPMDPLLYTFYTGRALTYLLAKDFKRAHEESLRSTQHNPNFATGLRALCAITAHLGRLGEARSIRDRLLAIDPTSTITRFKESPFDDAAVAPYIEGLRMAGLPES